ncbi:hypothetical protein [Photobacterium profundum]|uniref:Uncharacterized protein n=1 Tax=Photobacterium profundum (strain SS9) TaxID=298386 RepID=Q6LJT4_PHOPR|nr:hypothetical protein [Photobacterium profundum]CAG22446.1 hypothetical protein PBPRB0573 [Photobacterium profundum SS9]
MPYSRTDICNMSLGNIGHAEKIADYELERTPAAKHCRTYYEICVKTTLEDFDWSFARRVSPLALLSGESSRSYKYVYAFPDDCLVVRRINQVMFAGHNQIPNNLVIGYEKGVSSDGKRKVLFCDEPDIEIVYTSSDTNEALFTTTFVDAMTWRMGARLANVLPKNSKLSAQCQQTYSAIISQAVEQDTNAREVDYTFVAETVNERLS